MRTRHFFVYGTLTRGQVRQRCWPHSPREIQAATVQAALYDLGPYPALVQGSDCVRGEVWSFADDEVERTLEVLDEIECYSLSEDNLYRRTIIECRTAGGEVLQAYAYLYNKTDDLNQARRVEPDSDGRCGWGG